MTARSTIPVMSQRRMTATFYKECSRNLDLHVHLSMLSSSYFRREYCFHWLILILLFFWMKQVGNRLFCCALSDVTTAAHASMSVAEAIRIIQKNERGRQGRMRATLMQVLYMWTTIENRCSLRVMELSTSTISSVKKWILFYWRCCGKIYVRSD